MAVQKNKANIVAPGLQDGICHEGEGKRWGMWNGKIRESREILRVTKVEKWTFVSRNNRENKTRVTARIVAID